MNQVAQEKQKIIYIATYTLNIAINEEFKEIKNVMRGNNSRFEVYPEYVTSVGDISELIQNTKPSPQIIHICGEGKEDGMVEIPAHPDNPNPNEKKKVDRVKPEELAEFFRNAPDVRCVVLNFCYSSQAAELVAKYIPCVIGIDGYIERTAAVEFSKNFYRSLEGKPLNQNGIDEAFLKGNAAALPRTGDQSRYIKLSLSKPQPEMQIEVPEDGSIVSYPCECSGTFKNLYEGASMWAYVNATIEGKFYVVPINNYTNRSIDGKWRVSLYIGPSEGDNNYYRIGVFMVNPETTPGFKSKYDKAVEEHKYWALAELPNEGIEIFGGEREVKR